jgi:C-terminal processing protease CtpA/Prc
MNKDWFRRYFSAALALALIAASVSAPALAAGEKGWFGLTLSVDVEGNPFSPTLRTVKVGSVAASSPAASANLTSGDLIVEIEGLVVAGSKAGPLKTAMQKQVGEILHLKVKHGPDAPRDVSLTAAAKP